MAYLNKEAVAKIRKAIKAEFPKYTFSVICRDNDTLVISLMKADINLKEQYKQLGHGKLINNTNLKTVFNKVDAIRRTILPCEDRSDIMTDYFDVDYYYQYNVGKWNKEYTYLA